MMDFDNYCLSPFDGDSSKIIKSLDEYLKKGGGEFLSKKQTLNKKDFLEEIYESEISSHFKGSLYEQIKKVDQDVTQKTIYVNFGAKLFDCPSFDDWFVNSSFYIFEQLTSFCLTMGIDKVTITIQFDQKKSANIYRNHLDQFKRKYFEGPKLKGTNHYLDIFLLIVPQSSLLLNDFPFSSLFEEKEMRSPQLIHFFDILTAVWIGRFGFGPLKKRMVKFNRKEAFFFKAFDQEFSSFYEISFDDLESGERLMDFLFKNYDRYDYCLSDGFLGRRLTFSEMVENIFTLKCSESFLFGKQIFFYNRSHRQEVFDMALNWCRQNACYACLPCPAYFDSVNQAKIKHSTYDRDIFKNIGSCEFMERGALLLEDIIYG